MDSKSIQIEIPKNVKTLLERLNKNGYEAYIVGGCVRDSLLSKKPYDFDITTNAMPNEMLEIFSDFKIIPTGIKHGTLTIMIEDQSFEVTTYRMDGEYLDNRHPKEVTFSRSLAQDLERRDFTINALAYNKQDGLVDLFDGISDLKGKNIKCVGDPDKRFTEDALRIMRAIRFASTLGFKIDYKTKESILKNCHLLKNVSMERIRDELLKLLCGDNVTAVLIEYREVIATIIPELRVTFDFDQHNKHHIYNVYDHMAFAVGYSKPDPDVRLALLLHDIGKPACYKTDENGAGHFYGHGKAGEKISRPILKRLRLPTQTVELISDLILYHDYPIEPKRRVVLRRLNKFGEDKLRKLMMVKEGDSLAHNPKYLRRAEETEEINEIIDDVISCNECYSLKTLKISGTDLKSLGIPAGKRIGIILNTLLSEVIEGNIENSHEVLIARAKEWSAN